MDILKRAASRAPVVTAAAAHAARPAAAFSKLLPDHAPPLPAQSARDCSSPSGSRQIGWHPVELAAADREEVRNFFSDLDIDTLSEAHGSRCVLRMECAGMSGSHPFNSAVDDMVGRFGHADSCIGLRNRGGELVGLGFLNGVEGLPKTCRTHGLTVRKEDQRGGAGTLLKIAQLVHARSVGFNRAQVILDASDCKGVKAAANGASELPIVRLQRKAAALSGFKLHGPEEWDADSMVMWFELGEA